jgi:ABC-type uncharacterized transport system ATPase component
MRRCQGGVIVLLSVMAMLLIGSVTWAQDDYSAVVTGNVTGLTRQELYFKQLRFNIRPDVKIVMGNDSGKPVSLSTVAGVGHIEKGRLYIKGNQVVKIVILEMRQ